MTDSRDSWIIFENTVYGWLSPAMAPHLMRSAVMQPPTIGSREDFDRFIADLRAAADRVWPQGAA